MTTNRSIDQWAATLLNGEIDSRRQAAIASRELDTELQQQLLPTFIQLLRNEKDGQIRLAILDTVGDMGPLAAEAVDALLIAMQRKFGGRHNEELHQDYRAALALSHIGPAAVAGLQKLLADDADNLRIEAALALARIGPPAAAAMPELIALLDDANGQVRTAAQTALGSLGLAALDSLLAACNHAQPRVRAAAIAAVGHIGLSTVRASASLEKVRQTLHAALEDPESEVRAAAVRAVSALDVKDDQLPTILLQALRDPGEEVRVTAVNTLASRPELLQEMELDLAQLLTHGDAEVAWHAAFVLHLRGIEAVPILQQALHNDQCQVDVIARALALIGRPLIGPLSAWLEDPSPRVRQAAALALGRIRPLADETVLRLAKGLKDNDAAVRAAFVQALHGLGARARPAIAAIRQLSPDQDVAVRLQVIDILLAAAPRDGQLIDELIGILNNSEPVAQRHTMNSLRASGPFGRPAMPAVIKQLHNSDPSTRVAAAQFLGDHGSYAVEAVPHLNLMLQTDDEDIAWRIVVIDTLGELGKAAQTTLPNLNACLQDPHAEVRAAAVRALTNLQFSPQEIQPQISAALHDPDQAVRDAALSSLRRFGQRGAIFLPDVILLTANAEERDTISRVLERFERSATDPSMIDRLVKLLEHDQPEVRRWSIRFLGLAGSQAKNILPLLKARQQDAEELVRMAANEAIAKIDPQTVDATPDEQSATQASPRPVAQSDPPLTANPQPVQRSDQQARLKTAFAVVERAVAADVIPGAAALVMQHGQVLFERQIGVCDIEHAKPFQGDTLCWIASLTKPVTATAAMRLVERNKLQLDAPVTQYLPEFEMAAQSNPQLREITVRQLMCHASGIPTKVPLRPSFFFTQDWYSQDIATIADAIAQQPLDFLPGSRASYSNAAPYVLGRIIEKQSGQAFGDFVQQEILEPLQMSDTGFSIPNSKVERTAVVYRRQGDERVVYCRYEPDWQIHMTMPDGGLFSTTTDIARFANAFLGSDGGVLQPASVEQMLTSQGHEYGLGWILDREGQFSHWGSSGTLVWGDRATGVVGVLFAQMQDIPRLEKIHAEYRTAVSAAFK